MRLIVTRPAAQAAAWVGALRALGVDAVALPLIAIGPPADAALVETAWQGLHSAALVMFVSANAVAQFFALRPPGPSWPEGVRAAATGPGTSAALRRAGVPAACVVEPPASAESFDSEALWAQMAGEDWASRRVLVVRGEDGRDWLADQLGARGATVDFVAAYRRLAPQPEPAERALLERALAAPQAHLWLFSSSEAVGNLCRLAPGADWAQARAAVSHPRIARAAREAGFGQVCAVAPSMAAVAALASALPRLPPGTLA
jgi:uroporphyrinogen-III synthase